MFEQIILGIIQGFTEWIPVSSEGIIVLVKTYVFHHQEPLNQMINHALFLHLGTFLSAVVYFRTDIIAIFKAIPTLSFHSAETFYKENASAPQKLLVFLTLTTFISGSLGFLIIQRFTSLITKTPQAPMLITLLIACCLCITGFLQFKANPVGKKTTEKLKAIDGVLLGIAQGFAVLPGLSRSGTTLAVLLLRNFDKKEALRLSFLMSLPLILFGNIILNYKLLLTLNTTWPAILSSFIAGLVCIHFFIKIVEKINFGLFLIISGSLMIISIILRAI